MESRGAQQDAEGHLTCEGEEQTKKMEQSEYRWQRWQIQSLWEV